MGASAAVHPADPILRAYGLGKLDDVSYASVSKHLEACGACQCRVAELSSDDFLGRLQKVGVKPDQAVSGWLPSAATSTDGAARPSVPPRAVDTLPPDLVDHPDYEIVRELGRGGMGVVYLANNRLMGRPEVLKFVGRHLIERPGVADRFLREIRSAAKLQHPNIVAAYSAMRLGSSLVLAMEYVKGFDLAKIVKSNGPLPIAHACHFVHQAALGLQHALENDMVHRDIKPANLIVREGKKSVVKVLDFGLAKVTSEGQTDSGLTREGQMLGTPDFIAPEQIRDAQSADIRADIYSLGCTFYYLLTGGPPFRGEHLWDVYQAHFSMEAGPLNLVRPGVPVELAAVVAKMMAKEPERRFQTPADVARALAPFFKKMAAPPTDARQAYSQLGQSTTGPPMVLGSALPTSAAAIPEPGGMGVPATPHPEATWNSLISVDEREADSGVLPAFAPRRRPRWLWPSVAAGVTLLALIAGATVATTDQDGWNVWSYIISGESQPFNGRDLANWTGWKDEKVEDPLKVFAIENGQLVSTGPRGRIFSKLAVSEFAFKFEYKLHIKGQSDVARCLLKFDENEKHSIGKSTFRVSEVGCSLTNTSDKLGRVGDIMLYDFGTRNLTGEVENSTAVAPAAADEWNKVEIRCKGRMITFSINGTEVNQVQINGDRSIHCQPGFHHTNTSIRIRNIRIKPLSPTTFSVAGPVDALREDSWWEGSQELVFATLNKGNQKPPVSLRILTREGDTFTANWNSQKQAWKITGTIKEGQIHCSVDDVVLAEGNQKQEITGTIKDNVIELRYSGTIEERGRSHNFNSEVKLVLIR